MKSEEEGDSQFKLKHKVITVYRNGSTLARHRVVALTHRRCAIKGAEEVFELGCTDYLRKAREAPVGVSRKCRQQLGSGLTLRGFEAKIGTQRNTDDGSGLRCPMSRVTSQKARRGVLLYTLQVDGLCSETPQQKMTDATPELMPGDCSQTADLLQILIEAI